MLVYPAGPFDAAVRLAESAQASILDKRVWWRNYLPGGDAPGGNQGGPVHGIAGAGLLPCSGCSEGA